MKIDFFGKKLSVLSAFVAGLLLILSIIFVEIESSFGLFFVGMFLGYAIKLLLID